LIFTAVGAFLPRIDTGSAIANNVVFFLEKLPFLPFIAAITFEIQRVFARYCTTGPLRVVLWPGFLVQKITTIEPDDAQLEIALASLRATLFREEAAAKQLGGALAGALTGAGAGLPDEPDEPDEKVREVAFASYEALTAAGSLSA
jgi:Protein of unknown function (DUF1385)